MTARPLFIGNPSNAGKRWIATGFCAWLRKPGRVRPTVTFSIGISLAARRPALKRVVRKGSTR
jgi:hypothetical protein